MGTRYQLIDDLAAASGHSLSLSWRQLGYWDWLPKGAENILIFCRTLGLNDILAGCAAASCVCWAGTPKS